MHKYHFTKEVRQTLAGLPLPIAFYQFLDHRVVPLLLSQGFLDFFGIFDEDMRQDQAKEK